MTEKTLDERVAEEMGMKNIISAYREWERDKKILTRLWGKDFYGDPRERINDAGPKPHYAGIRLTKKGFVVVYTTHNGFNTAPFGLRTFFTPKQAAQEAEKVGFSVRRPLYNFEYKRQFLLREASSFFKYGEKPRFPKAYFAEVALWIFHQARSRIFPEDYK